MREWGDALVMMTYSHAIRPCISLSPPVLGIQDTPMEKWFGCGEKRIQGDTAFASIKASWIEKESHKS